MAIYIRVARIYDKVGTQDGVRLLVDRLWPRGVSKQDAKIDHWPKALTPSHELRKWFHADSANRQDEFAAKYTTELNERTDEIGDLLGSIDSQTITLVTATKDLENGHVAVLKKFLEKACN